MIFTLLRGIVFLIPMFCLLPAVFPEAGVWMAIPASEILTLAVILVTYRRHKA